jgi:hypothetical protein
MGRGGCLAIALVWLLAASHADAATRFAEPAGNGPEPCLSGDPCEIEDAIEGTNAVTEVVNGDEILLLPGTYTVAPATILSATDTITIRPRDTGTRPTISSTGPSVIALNAAATLSDVAIVNTTSTGNGETLRMLSPGAVAQRVTVDATMTGGNFQVACNLFDGLLRDSTCRVTHAGGTFGIAAGSVVGGPTGTYTPRFVNVTAASGGGTVTPLLAQSNGANVAVSLAAHNVIAQSVIAGTLSAAGSTASATLTRSNFQASTTTGTGTTVTPAGSATNQTAVPVFVNAAGGDFRQAATSPTINAGAGDADLGTQDPEFQARSQGTAPDIGADEFNVPPAPSITDTDPNSPANDNNPEVKGTAEAGSTVKVYSTSDCSGAPLATGSAVQFASSGITAPVPDNAITNLRATANDGLDHPSACSAPFAYQEDSTPPPAPQIITTDPISPANDNTPEVRGAADMGSTVKVYSNSDCTGTPLATGTADQFASPGITVNVADNRTIDLRATASDPPGNESACSTPISYTENSLTGPGGDVAAPETRIDSAPKGKIKTTKKKASISISFSANEPATFRCSLDGAAEQACSSPFKAKVGQGSHSFEVTATDTAGNRDESPAKASFKVKRKQRRR